METIIDSIYPLTIVADRYNGTYSGGKFIAFNLYPSDIPWEVFGGDMDCLAFWTYQSRYKTYGIGETIEEAIADLYTIMKERNG